MPNTSTNFGENAITLKVYKQISAVRKELLQTFTIKCTKGDWNIILEKCRDYRYQHILRWKHTWRYKSGTTSLHSTNRDIV